MIFVIVSCSQLPRLNKNAQRVDSDDVNNFIDILDMNEEIKKSDSSFQPNDEQQDLLKVAATISPRALAHTKHLFSLIAEQDNGTLNNSKIKIPELFPWEYSLKTHSPSPICSKRIHESAVRTAFSCFDCRECDNSILCYECFSHSSHDGHRYIQFQTTGGCCDCGDIDAWNELGFCNQHGKATNSQDIDPAAMDIFTKEIGFAFGLYFWLMNECKKGRTMLRVRYVYGTILLGHSANLVAEEFQLKYLLNHVLQKPVQVLGQSPKSQLSVVQQFFRMQEVEELVQFNKLSIELFPVQEFRFTFIRYYFEKTLRNEMPLEHPLKQLNYQYMGRAKVISMLIEQGQIQPLQLTDTPSTSPEELTSLFRKYADDITYLIKPKSALQYFQLHFQRINICQMFFYRKYTTIQKSGSKILLDDLMLKIYGEMLKIIINEKTLLEKIMRELIEYVLGFINNTYSLVHERAFAMTVVAYLQGDISVLSVGNFRMRFMQIMNQKDIGIFNQAICALVKRHLWGMVLAQITLEGNHFSDDDFQINFMSNYPQRYLLESLDRVYIKLLIRLHHGPFPLQFTFHQLIKTAYSNRLSDYMHTYATSPCQFSVYVVETVNSILALEIDEVVVCDQIQVDCHEKCFDFLKRFLKSYPMVSAKQLKTLSKFIINNDQLIDSFLTKEVKVERGKIVASFPQKPLEIFIYRKCFSAMRIDIFKAVPTYFQKIPRSAAFTDTSIYTEESTNIILKSFEKRIKYLIQQEGSYELFPDEVESYILILAQIYAETSHEGCKELFATIMSIKVKYPCRKEAVDQANYTMSPQEDNNESPIKLKQMQDGTKKKQALLKKRREKEELMKKKQQEHLKNYGTTEEQNSLETCIYCKQNSNTQLYFVAYCNFTSLYEKKCLQTQGQHIFLQTCGHKIHQECYETYLGEASELNVCFLCRRHVNFLIPYFHEGTSLQIKKKQQEEFLSIIYPIFLLKYEDKQDMVNQFFGGVHGDSTLSVLTESFIREIILRAFYDVGSFEKDIIPIYSMVLNVIETKNEQSMRLILEEMRQRINSFKTQSQFKYCELILIETLQEFLFKTQPHQQNKNYPKYQKVKTLFQQVLSLFSKNAINSIEFAQVQLAQKYPIVRELPQKLTDLLPVKPQCGVCHKLTNRLLACLLCEWVGCDDDIDCMKKHCQKQHIDGSIFVFLYNGQIIYVFDKDLYVTDSIYQDYLGESMNREKRQYSKEQIQKYSLDKEEFSMLKKIPIQHIIHQYASK